MCFSDVVDLFFLAWVDVAFRRGRISINILNSICRIIIAGTNIRTHNINEILVEEMETYRRTIGYAVHDGIHDKTFCFHVPTRIILRAVAVLANHHRETKIGTKE